MKHPLIALALVVLLAVAGCGGGGTAGDSDASSGTERTLSISAIPDQDPAKLTAREQALAAYLAEELDIDVEFVPVTDYAASVSLFRAGDLDMVFYGGLTGVQARLQTPGAVLLAQRDIDAEFRSVFIANADAGIEPVTETAGLTAYKGKRFTFGSESSTSGRLMPDYFLREAGISESDFTGQPGFSGSHDQTIDLVQAGSYDGGALNLQVWTARKEAGTVDLDRVKEIFITPTYHDYHWIAGPELDADFGAGFTEKLRMALLALDGSSPQEVEVLEMYGAESIIPTEASNYDQIEKIARELKLVS
ncbi:putative selenate ABC transporter substrate-binding protein [Granulicoccus sp. GXG6511]|uniref:putative selenate ABC transporter substrate-binding protein n=1 Tax=Granulicoccus sp. GXG6511 TaxID=3381351 RepID=UPI003D7D9322